VPPAPDIKPKLLSPSLQQNLEDIITCPPYSMGIHYVKVHVIQTNDEGIYCGIFAPKRKCK